MDLDRRDILKSMVAGAVLGPTTFIGQEKPKPFVVSGNLAVYCNTPLAQRHNVIWTLITGPDKGATFKLPTYTPDEYRVGYTIAGNRMTAEDPVWRKCLWQVTSIEKEQHE